MALQKAFTTEHGIELPAAYCRIDSFRGDRQHVRIWVGIYADEEQYGDGKPALTSREYLLPTPNTSGNMFADVYNYLKTLPEFDGATDV